MPYLISDRSDYILNKNDYNPAYGGYECVKMLSKTRNDNVEYIIGIPCNSFHAPVIFNEFYNLTSKLNNVIIINMLSSTVNYIKNNFKCKNIGILSTTGTRICGSYLHYFTSKNYNLIQVPNTMQSLLHQAIYDIKSNFPPKMNTIELLYKFIDILINEGSENIILGCTELPLAIKENLYKNIPIIDPIDILAKTMILYANPNKLKKFNF